MNTTKGFLALCASALIIASCSFGKKKDKADECEGCPEPVTIEIPAELEQNKDAVVFVKDAEVMFNKWSKRAYLLVQELEALESIDTADMSFSESMQAAKVSMKMLTYMGEFMTEGLTMTDRMTEIKSNMSEEESAAFDETMEQFDEQMDEISKTFNELGVDTPESTEALVDMVEEGEEVNIE